MCAALLLEKHRDEELRRLGEKAEIMRRRPLSERERWMDDFWRKKNAEILDMATALLGPD